MSAPESFRTPAARLFYSYSHHDEPMLEQLQKHLALLRRRGLITEWYDRNIDAGERWRDEILRELEAADLILLLVSSDFLNSDFCYDEETMRAIERADRGEATVIAVMLRPVDGWTETRIAQLQVVPRDAQPITTWTNADEAWSDVAAEIRAVVEKRAQEDLPRELRPSEDEVRLGEEVLSGADAETDSTTATRVDEVAEALEELVRQPESNDPKDNPHVIVNADAARDYYTQYLANQGVLWCEAVSNEHLAPEYALTDEQMSRLIAFGWNPPQGDLPNWWYEPDVSSPREVAWLSVQTLDKVYGVALDRPFDIVRSWTPVPTAPPPDPATAARVYELAEVLETLLQQPWSEDPADNPFVIVVADSERNYFTQYLGTSEGLWCEAVSNETLDSAYALTDEQMSRLLAFGWNPPEEQGLPNWWYAPEESSPSEIAWLSVQTLNQVYGVPLDRPFEIQTSWT